MYISIYRSSGGSEDTTSRARTRTTLPCLYDCLLMKPPASHVQQALGVGTVAVDIVRHLDLGAEVTAAPTVVREVPPCACVMHHTRWGGDSS